MSTVRSVTACLAGLALCLIVPLQAAASQSAYYASLALGASQLQPPRGGFSVAPARHPVVELGWLLANQSAVELRVSRIDVETTESAVAGQEAPYTIGMRATFAELAYSYRFPAIGGRVQPRTSLGVAWIPLVDRWRSDTPTETARSSVYGITPSVGTAIRLVGPLALSFRASYLYAGDNRSPTHIGVNGFRLEGGAELGR